MATRASTSRPSGASIMTLETAEQNAIDRANGVAIVEEDDSPLYIEEDIEEESGLSKLLTELGAGDQADGNVVVLKVRPGEQKPSHCFKCPASEFTLDKIAREYGGGKFKVMIYGSLGRDDGRYGLRYNQIHEIEPKILSVETVSSEPPMTRAEFMRILSERPAQAPAAVDPMAMMSGMLGMMVSMKELMPQPAPSGGIVEMLTGMKAIKELAGDLVPGGEPKSDVSAMLDTAKSFLPVVSQMVQSRQQPAPTLVVQRPPAQRVIPPRIATLIPPNQNPAPKPAPAEAPVSQEQKMYGEQLGILASKAARGADPGLYAEVLLDEIGEENEVVFEAFLKEENWFELLCNFNDVIRPHQQWFAALRQAVFELLSDSGEEESVASSGVTAFSAPIVMLDGSVDPDIQVAQAALDKEKNP